MDRFWEKVDKSGECWLWTGAKDRKGYGRLSIAKTPQLVHRLAYSMLVGKIKPGKCVCHTCDNPSCVNPKHLFIGSIQDNNRDMWKKRRNYCPVGVLSGRSKLTETQVLEIRDAIGSHREIAKIYGVSHRVIGRIKTREIWSHI